MSKIRVKLRAKRHINIHNDLSNAAFYFKSGIEKKVKSGTVDGIGLDSMAALVMIAFALEAKLNFLGYKLIGGWNERARFHEKAAAVFDRLEIAPDQNSRPFSTIRELKNFRDTLAHGKPIEIFLDEEVVATEDEIEEKFNQKVDWENSVNPDFVERAYSDVEDLWKIMLEKSGMNIFETVSHGSHSISFIEFIEK